MANTCFTDYTIVGEKEKVEKLHQDMMRVFETKRKDKDDTNYESYSNWLGWLVKDLLGKSYKDMHCRGTFYMENELTNGELRFTTSSAWVPCSELFKSLAEKYGVAMYYYAEELGCSLLETNDSEQKYYKNRFVVSCSDCDDQYFESETALVNALNAWTGKRHSTLEDLRNDEDIDKAYNIYEIEVI
jgi:hypothetical protein